jgi:hypothetical protein
MISTSLALGWKCDERVDLDIKGGMLGDRNDYALAKVFRSYKGQNHGI